ncbi:MAG: hypothetical protein IKE94_03785 [Aeriscardovia sp.]|nr:hypothetical protein [Aeriscardovia sp.]
MNYKTKKLILSILVPSDGLYIQRFLKHLRQYETLIKKPTSIITTIRRIWHLRCYQRYAGKLGYCIGDGVLGKDVLFYHRGSIIINPDARVGDGCRFHGDAVLGVSHTNGTGCPTLGKNVDIGVGAKILGDIYIADNIIIGANAVVTKSFYEPGITIAGIPAKKIKGPEDSN